MNPLEIKRHPYTKIPESINTRQDFYAALNDFGTELKNFYIGSEKKNPERMTTLYDSLNFNFQWMQVHGGTKDISLPVITAIGRTKGDPALFIPSTINGWGKATIVRPADSARISYDSLMVKLLHENTNPHTIGIKPLKPASREFVVSAFADPVDLSQVEKERYLQFLLLMVNGDKDRISPIMLPANAIYAFDENGNLLQPDDENISLEIHNKAKNKTTSVIFDYDNDKGLSITELPERFGRNYTKKKGKRHKSRRGNRKNKENSTSSRRRYRHNY